MVAIYAEFLAQEVRNQENPVFPFVLDFSKDMSHLPFTKDQEAILNQVWQTFSQMNDNTLKQKILQEQPWREAYEPNQLHHLCIIKPLTLYHFFSQRQKKGC